MLNPIPQHPASDVIPCRIDAAPWELVTTWMGLDLGAVKPVGTVS